MDQQRSLAGSKIADTETMVEVPLDDAYPEVTPLRQPEQPQMESADSQADSSHVYPLSPRGSQDLAQVSTPEDLSAMPQSQIPEVSRTEESAKAQVPKRYATRVHSKPKLFNGRNVISAL